MMVIKGLTVYLTVDLDPSEDPEGIGTMTRIQHLAADPTLSSYQMTFQMTIILFVNLLRRARELLIGVIRYDPAVHPVSDPWALEEVTQ